MLLLLVNFNSAFQTVSIWKAQALENTSSGSLLLPGQRGFQDRKAQVLDQKRKIERTAGLGRFRIAERMASVPIEGVFGLKAAFQAAR